MSQTQVQTRDAYGTTYADPTDVNFTVRFKHTSTRKALGTTTTENHVLDIIVNDLYDVATGTNTTSADSLSVRVRISGSSKSDARLGAIVAQIAAQLPSWVQDDKVHLGFEAKTAPVNPV